MIKRNAWEDKIIHSEFRAVESTWTPLARSSCKNSGTYDRKNSNKWLSNNCGYLNCCNCKFTVNITINVDSLIVTDSPSNLSGWLEFSFLAHMAHLTNLMKNVESGEVFGFFSDFWLLYGAFEYRFGGICLLLRQHWEHVIGIFSTDKLEVKRMVGYLLHSLHFVLTVRILHLQPQHSNYIADEEGVQLQSAYLFHALR